MREDETKKGGETEKHDVKKLTEEVASRCICGRRGICGHRGAI